MAAAVETKVAHRKPLILLGRLSGFFSFGGPPAFQPLGRHSAPDTQRQPVQHGPHADTPASALASAVFHASRPPIRFGTIGPVPEWQAQPRNVCGRRFR